MTLLPSRPGSLVVLALLSAAGLPSHLVMAAGAAPVASPAPDPGHSAHGESFSQGPRSAGYLMAGTGDVHFPITCKLDEAQQFFDQGIGQLHGFWYLEAERSFRQAVAIDPTCVMAYWGMAMANINNGGRASSFIEEAWTRKDSSHLNPIEIAWIEALHDYLGNAGGDSKAKSKKLITRLRAMHEEFPKDLELMAFLVYFIYEEAPREDYPFAIKLLDEIHIRDPHHPSHHYGIHLCESMGTPAGALVAAAQNGPSAPGIAHMWHMSGHTYSALGRYEDAVWYQEAGARVDHAYMIRDRVMPFQIFNYTHNSEWLVRNLLTVGRAHDAMEMSANMIELPRRPADVGLLGTERLLDTLSMYQMWDELLSFCARGYLHDDVETSLLIRKLRYEGVANAARGHLDAAHACIAKLQAQRKKLQPVESADSRPAPTRHSPVAGALAAVLDFFKKDPAPAVAGAAPKAPPATRPSKALVATTGPTTRPAKPARRKVDRDISDQLAAIDKAISHIKGQEAISAGDFAKGIALLTAADERKEHLALAALAAGNLAKAQEQAAQAADNARPYPLATQVLVLHRAGKKTEAAELFTTLRGLSEKIDLQAEPFKSLCEIAPDYGYPPDFRIPRKLPADAGPRPKFDSLGPLVWHPTAAPRWSAATGDGSRISLDAYRGKPVILFFYLGHGCPHCVRQIHDFAQAQKQFAAAGISLLAIGTDTPQTLGKTWSMAQIQADPLAFLLASDTSMEIFKAYHCYDAFEKMPLHGTFLIDAQGLIRWQDIGPEPFLNTGFLLKESKRLLAIPG